MCNIMILRSYCLKRMPIFVLIVSLFLFTSCEKKKLKASGIEKKFFEDLQITPADEEDKVNDINFKYQLSDTKIVELDRYEGKIIILNFWATWCSPCLKEMPDFESLSHKMKDYQFEIVAINAGEHLEKVKKFLEKYPYSFEFGIDNTNKILEKYQIYGLPSTLILDENLKIIAKALGPKKWSSDISVKYFKSRSQKKK